MFDEMRATADGTPTNRAIGWIIVTHGGEAVGVRKLNYQQSMISFVPIVINGITYREGSLFRANMDNAPDSKNERQARDIGTISTIGFMRLSAFSTPVEQRAREFGPGYSGTRGYDMEDVRALANT